MLDVRLARLALPLPLELAIRRALVHPERATQHEGLVLAWELAARILASALWAAAREVGASSTALGALAAKLDRPSFGHWVELARTCASLLQGRTEPAAQAFAKTLAGLADPLPNEGGLALLAARIAALPARNRPKPRRVQELLDALPFYRNEAQSTHGDVPAAFREESVPALLEGLIDFCERVPLTGACSVVFVRRLERASEGHVAELARLHGNSVTWLTRRFDEASWKRLAPARPYLLAEPDVLVPLFPMAAVSQSGGEWRVGWYARAVHVPTVAYQGVAGQEFQLALAPDELASITRGARATPDEAAAAAALALDPFRGLLTYEEEHAAIFFGREEETDAALARLAERSALFVYGASGSGKSSWLRAGIVPALRARAALAGKELAPILLLPGDRPLAALRRAVTSARGGAPEEAARWAREVDETLSRATAALIHADASSSAGANRAPSIASTDAERALAHLLRGLAALGRTPVLLVDQMEEAATIALDRVEGRAFLALVAGAAASAAEAGTIVLASARADLLPHLIEHASMRAFLERDGQPIGSIPPERLARVITEPLRGRRVSIEPGLPETILSDVASEPGALALLSQVLTTLWSERERFGGGLTKQGYVDAGRVSGALEKQAEAALAEVRAAVQDADAKAAERRVDRFFRALAQSDAGERFTRRRVELDALVSELGTTEPELRALAGPFVKRRLVILGGESTHPAAEVAHERLLDAWPRLRNLLASEREALDLRREIEAASAAWQAAGGKREFWSDATSKLRRSEELFAAERLDVDARGRAFLAASRAATTRRKRIERATIAALVVLVLAASGAAFVAQRQTARANEETKKAEDLATAAVAKEREGRVRGLISKLEYFETLDDDVYAYARRQSRPAAEWWIEGARALVNGVEEDPSHGKSWQPGLSDVRKRLEELRRLAKPRTQEDVQAGRGWSFDDDEQNYTHKELERLVADLERVSKQLAFAEASVKDADAARAWEHAIAEIAKSETYRGTKWPNGVGLTPQLGLVPIGADPKSGLWEFAHLATGRPARRGADGVIERDDAMGLVMVLLPGGRVPVANSAEQGQDESLTRVELDPFFVSKYEMTAAEWARIEGWRRSRSEEREPLMPASGLSWDGCQIALGRNAGWLRLPSEAQWEYACRAGTTFMWWTGDDVEALEAAANLTFGNADRQMQAIGHLLANGFGLHDVHGNAWEWCQDAYGVKNEERRAGDGLLDMESAADRVLRGGGYWGEPDRARSSYRDGDTPDVRSVDDGLRPSQGIAP